MTHEAKFYTEGGPKITEFRVRFTDLTTLVTKQPTLITTPTLNPQTKQPTLLTKQPTLLTKAPMAPPPNPLMGGKGGNKKAFDDERDSIKTLDHNFLFEEIEYEFIENNN